MREREKERRLPPLLGLIAEQVHRNVSPSVHLFPMRPRPPDDSNQPGNRQSWTPHGCRRRPTAGWTRARASQQERKKVTEARLFFSLLYFYPPLCVSFRTIKLWLFVGHKVFTRHRFVPFSIFLSLCFLPSWRGTSLGWSFEQN